MAIVYIDGSFYSVTAQSFKEVDAPVPDLDALPGSYPKWVTVKLPEDLDEQSVVRGKMLGGWSDVVDAVGYGMSRSMSITSTIASRAPWTRSWIRIATPKRYPRG